LNLKHEHLIHWHGKPLQKINKAFRSARDKAGLDAEVIPYTIRYIIATELGKRGLPEWECQGFLGHRSGGTTERYAKYRSDHLRAAIKAIDDYCLQLNPKAQTPIVLDAIPISRARYAPHG
jgi:integrase